MQIQSMIHEHPILGFIATIALNIIAFISSPDNAPHIPEIVMQCGQLVAWASAFVVMCISVHGWYAKHIKKQKEV
jgi:hypothetical protein